MLDTATLPAGKSYMSLKDTYIIFLCTFDPVDLGLPVYTVRQTYVETTAKDYDEVTSKNRIFSSKVIVTNERIKGFRRKQTATLRLEVVVCGIRPVLRAHLCRSQHRIPEHIVHKI